MKVYTDYLRKDGKVAFSDTVSYSLFDKGFAQYAVKKPQITDKDIAKLLKKQEQKVIVWVKKQKPDDRILIGYKNGQVLSWPMTSLSNNQINSTVEEIFKRSDILQIKWDLKDKKADKLINAN